MEETEQSAGAPMEAARDRPGWPALAAIGALMLVYAIAAVSTWGLAYLDFGDGNYLYVSGRVADGLVLYRDVLSPQPPIHTVVGSALLRLGRAAGLDGAFYAVRGYSLALHLATALLVAWLARFLLARTGEGRPAALDAATVAAALLYLTIPLGFWWTLGYQTHPTLMFIFLASLHLLLRDRPGTVAAAGGVAALAPLTSMTATPYIAFTLVWLLVRRPRRFLHFAVPLVGVYALVAAWFQWRTGGAFLENVVFNQVGSFPKPEISGEPLWRYAARKITTQGAKVIGLEGIYLLAGGVGLAWWTRRAWRAGWRYADFVALYTLGFWGSIVYTAKGATVDYIFTLGEPLLCVFGGLAVAAVAMRMAEAWRGSAGRRRRVLAWGAAALVLLAGTTAVRNGLFYASVLREQQFELSEAGVREVAETIERHTEPGDAILAPPFYAFVTGRRVAGEYAEIFLWTIKYWNERIVLAPGEAPPDGGIAKARELAGMMERREIPLVLLDLAQTGRIPEIREAIEAHYRPLGPAFSTMNTPLRFYVPGEREPGSGFGD